MTKEEKIKEAKLKYKDGSLGLLYAIKEIENNNGWIKIESEADLPKKNIECFFMFEGDLLLGSFFIDDNCFYWNDSRDFENKGITHYQPIEKPKPPIY